jgi:putative ABC transport system permease protein
MTEKISLLRAVLARLAAWFGKTRRERDWTTEFESHLRLHIDDNLRAGMSAEEARRQALLKFGSVESVKESMRDQATFIWIDTLWQDIRYSWRSLRKNPGFTLTAVLSLALGLGASLAVFTVADNLLVRPLPYSNSSQLVMVWEANPQRDFHHSIASPGNYMDWKAQNNVFAGMAGLRESRSVLIDGDRAEEFGKQSVTSDFFQVLGVQPVRGRLFTTEEDRASKSTDTLVLISYQLWQSWFGGNDDVIGRKVLVNAVPRTIIGVLPPNFYFLNRKIDLWEPVGLNPAEDYRKTQGRWMTCIARMRPGVTIQHAQAQMTTLAARLEKAYPDFNNNWTVEIESLRDSMLSDRAVRQDSRTVKTSLLVLLAAVGLMLAVACANVANLLLARYSSRRREMAVRASLGAGRGRVIRQLLTESLLLSVVGGSFGIILARWGVRGLLALAPATLTQSTDIHFDSRVFLAAFALSMLTGILFGVAPALVTSRVDLLGALGGDSRSSVGAGGRLRAWLVGAEVAVSVVLLAGAMLLFRSLVGFEALHPGLDPTNLLTFRVSLPAARYQKVSQRTQFFKSAIEQIEHLPGVRSASAVIFPPFNGPGYATWANIEGHPPAKPGQERLAFIRSVMPGYFQTLRIPIRHGRDFTESDNLEKSPQRFIVNEAFVHQFMPDEQPLGKKINALMETENPFGEIVGVVGDVREWSIDHAPTPTVYYTYSQLSFPSMIFLVRAERNPASLAEPARRIVRGLDSAQPIAEIRTMQEILGENFARQRFSAWLLSGFSIVALLLAAVGIYGVLAYSVTARTRELGVRAALGADSAHIIALVLKMGARPVLGGVVAGTAGALALTGLLKSLLFGVGPRDPVTFLAVPCVLALVALIAAYLPARRAARLHPMEALRVE